MAEGKVVFANADVTLHQTSGEITSPFGDTYENVTAVTLLPGQSVPLDSLPKYQQETVLAGKCEAVEVVSEDEAEKKAEYIEKVRRAVAGGSVVDAAALSLSDHEVPDEVKAENHAKRGKKEAGSGDAPNLGKQTRSAKGSDAVEGETLEDSK